MGNKEQEKAIPVGQKTERNPVGLFLLFISFSVIPIPGYPEAAVVMIAAIVGRLPKFYPEELRS